MSVGRFIVLEGIDGAGTTTQLERLTEWLQGSGSTVLPTWQPSDRPIGQHIRRILRGEDGTSNPEAVALMFAADRLEHLQLDIIPAVNSGTHVICDRYVGSSLAYQGSFCDIDWVRQINSYAREADVTIYVRVDVDTAMARMKNRGGKEELFEKRESLTRVAEGYDALFVHGTVEGPTAVVVDGTQSPDDVFAQCCAAVKKIL